MKNLLFLALFIAGVSCQPSGKQDPQESFYDTSTTEITIDKENDGAEFWVDTTYDWALVSTEKWCTASPTSGNQTHKVTVTAPDYDGGTEGKPRKAKIKVVFNGDLDKTIDVTVTQEVTDRSEDND